MILTRGYVLSHIHRLLTIYNKRTFEPRLIFESFSSLTTGNPGSLYGFHNMGKYREHMGRSLGLEITYIHTYTHTYTHTHAHTKRSKNPKGVGATGLTSHGRHRPCSSVRHLQTVARGVTTTKTATEYRMKVEEKTKKTANKIN